MNFGYEQIKALAKETRCKVTDLIALAAQNDPFYQGTPATRALAEWFSEIYYERGWRWERNHIRRCHYQIVHLSVTLPNGVPLARIFKSRSLILTTTRPQKRRTAMSWARACIIAGAHTWLRLTPISSFRARIVSQ